MVTNIQEQINIFVFPNDLANEEKLAQHSLDTYLKIQDTSAISGVFQPYLEL